MARSSGPTLNDVARRSGVSATTVSYVLHGRRNGASRISEQTRERVLTAVAELDYSPNLSARALRRQRSGVIGFVPRFSRQTPYEHPVPFLLGLHIANAAMKRGYHVIEASAETARSRESDELVRFLRERGVDGVILDSPETTGEVQRLIDRGLPVVQVIRPRTDVPTPAISVDSRPGIASAVNHLVELGHHDIGFIGHGGLHPTDRSRVDCFRATLTRHRLLARDEWIVPVDDYAIEEGYTAAKHLLARAAMPTALFIAGDNLALGVLQALHESDIRVPDALSVVSYDDIFAAHLPPPLTSVAQPLEDVGEQAITLLTNRLEETTSDVPENIILPTSLTIRGSTRPPAAGKGVV